MKKKLLLTATASLLMIGGIALADFKASGTAYSKSIAAQEKWTDDAANDFVSMPTSFASVSYTQLRAPEPDYALV